jgi:hypothetical protein
MVTFAGRRAIPDFPPAVRGYTARGDGVFYVPASTFSGCMWVTRHAG